jgi:hypothetical protein
MKNRAIKISLIAGFSAVVVYSCKREFLEVTPQGIYSETQLNNAKGVDGMLISTYAALGGLDGAQLGGASNWTWGSITGGEAYKGTEFSDFVDINPIMRYEIQPSNPALNTKWNSCYNGVARANQVLRTLPKVNDMADAAKKQVEAEAKFLRAHYHFELKKVFNNVPFVDEGQIPLEADFKIPNTSGSGYVNIWPQIEADLKFAFENLDETRPNRGRANKWAAASFLAKAYMFQNKFAEAKALFDQIIVSGKTAQGTAYALTSNYQDNFRVTSENNSESIFAIQYSYGDGSNTNGNYDNSLNYPHSGQVPSGIAGCCGFFQPSQTFVNAFQTDANGLPLVESFNNTEILSDEGILGSIFWNSTTKYKKNDFVSRIDPATPTIEKAYRSKVDDNAGNDPLTSANWELVWTENATITLDPRLDHSVGRKGIPFLDWGNHPGRGWIRDQPYGGPYAPKKNVFFKSDVGQRAGSVGWGWNNNALNYTIMRFADVLLLAAEAEIEVGSLAKASEYINRVRTRAANSPLMDVNAPAANYKVGLYTAFAGKDDARKAVRFERMLELGMEGHRMFDLNRWGITADYINNVYLAKEKQRRPSALGNATFTPNQDEYMPIPEYAINQSMKDGQATLKQNPGY